MRHLSIAICLVLGFTGVAFANPLDSPSTVYIDGLPCNTACQSYMAWSRETLRASHQPDDRAPRVSARPMHEPNDHAPHVSARRLLKRSPNERVARRAVPPTAETSLPEKTTDQQPEVSAARSTPAPAGSADDAPPKIATQERDSPPQQQAERTPQAESASQEQVERKPQERERTPQEQVMAALAVAEQITNASLPAHSEESPAEKDNATSTGDTAQPSPGHPNEMVALVMSRPDVTSVASLSGATIAVDEAQSAAKNDIRIALVAAGAMGVELTASNTKAIDQVINGDIPAAVLRLVSADAADAFPEIKGFKIFRVPLSPR